jgi:hypothetical protein
MPRHEALLVSRLPVSGGKHWSGQVPQLIVKRLNPRFVMGCVTVEVEGEN